MTVKLWQDSVFSKTFNLKWKIEVQSSTLEICLIFRKYFNYLKYLQMSYSAHPKRSFGI